MAGPRDGTAGRRSVAVGGGGARASLITTRPYAGVGGCVPRRARHPHNPTTGPRSSARLDRTKEKTGRGLARVLPGTKSAVPIRAVRSGGWVDLCAGGLWTGCEAWAPLFPCLVFALAQVGAVSCPPANVCSCRRGAAKGKGGAERAVDGP